MLSETVKAYLTAGWTLDPTPNIALGSRTETVSVDLKKLPKIIITEGMDVPDPKFNGSAEISNEVVTIDLYSKTRDDADDYYAHAKTILNGKSLSGGWWRCRNRIHLDKEHFIQTNFEMVQTIFQAT